MTSERYWEARWRDERKDNESLSKVIAQKDNEIYELRQHLEGQRYKVEQLQDALDQRRILDQSLIDEAIRASTKVKDEEIARLRKNVELLEASRREIIEIDEQRVAEIESFRGKLAEQCGKTLAAQKEIERQRGVIDDYERERISRLGGIGSPA